MSFDMILAYECRSKTNPVLPRNLERERGIREDVFVKQGRRFEEYDVVGRDLGEEVREDRVEELFSLV